MKIFRPFLAALCVLMLCSAFTMKDKTQHVYIFGIAASFNDTVVYHTDIQLLDSVQLDKEGFLPYRSSYSDQLKMHIEHQLLKPNYTCAVYFSNNKSKLEKEALQLKELYQNSGMSIQAIDPSQFTFKKPEE